MVCTVDLFSDKKLVLHHAGLKSWCNDSTVNADQHPSMSNTKLKMLDHSVALALDVGVQAGVGLNKSYAMVGSKDSTYRI